jgi:hypothetical protein
MFSTTTPEHPGVPLRPATAAHFLVTSTDRYKDTFDRLLSPTTSANWTMSKNYNLLNGYFTRLAITQIQFWWNLPTVIEGVNDMLSIAFDLASDILTITIDPGYYTVATLAAEIESKIQAHVDYDPAWDFQVNVVEDALQFTSTVDSQCVPEFPQVENAERINKFMITAGLNGSAGEEITPGNFVISYATAPMTYTSFIDICSSRLTQFQRVKDGTTLINNTNADVIARVYPCPPNQIINSAQPGQLFAQPWVMTIDYNTPKYIRWDAAQAITNFDIQLKDEFGDIIYWSVQYPTEYQMTMIASEQ